MTLVSTIPHYVRPVASKPKQQPKTARKMSPRGKSEKWSDEREAELRRLWETDLSTAEIAAKMGGGLTKNAIIGKSHRLHLPLRRPSTKTSEGTMVEPSVRVAKAQPSLPLFVPCEPPEAVAEPAFGLPVAQVPADEVSSEGIAFFDLAQHHCKWPIGKATGLDMRYCGQPRAWRHGDYAKLGMHAYCADHCRLAYAPSSPPSLKEAAE